MNAIARRRGFWGRLWDGVIRRVPRGAPGGDTWPTDHAPRGEGGLLDRRWFSGVTPDNEEIGSDFASMAAWATTARSMLRTDPVLSGAWAYVAQRQMGGLDESVYEPTEDTQEARRNAAFANENMGLGEYKGRARMWKGLREQWRTIILWQPFGASLHEVLTFEAPDRSGVSRLWLRSLEPRSLTRLEGWEPLPDQTGVAGAWMLRAGGDRYYLPIDGSHPDLPGKRCLHIAADIEGGDPEGRLGAMLRPGYGYWRLKRLALDQLGVGLERWGSELPVGRINYEVLDRIQNSSDARLREARAQLRTALRDMKAREEAYALDSDIAEIRPFGARFEPAGLRDLIDTLNGQMLTGFFMQALVMGTQASGTGSYNNALVHQDGANQIYSNLAELTAEAFTQQVMRPLIRANFGEGSPIPRLVMRGVRTDPLPAMAPHLAQAAGYGGITPTDALEAALLRAAGLGATFPSRTPEDRLGRAPAPVAPGPGPGRPAGSVEAPSTEQVMP